MTVLENRRINPTMPVIKLIFENQSLQCRDNETVLEALERQNCSVSFSCRNGICHSCLMRCTKGSPGDESQKGLDPELAAKGYFLPCKCNPTAALQISAADPADLFKQATIIQKQWLCESVIQLQLQPSSPILYQGGQYIQLRHPQGLTRNYSIASNLIEDPYIELQIKRTAQGKMSHWLCDTLQEQDNIDFLGPLGHCCYQKGDRSRNLLLIATGSGLAPLQGIIKEALLEAHSGDIYLYHGSRFVSGLYNGNYLEQLARKYSNFFYYPCVSGEHRDKFLANTRIQTGRASDVAFKRHPQLQDWEVYICGPGDMVQESFKRAQQQQAGKILYEDF